MNEIVVEQKFSPRQEEIIRMAARALGRDDMARGLGISPGTAASHLNSVYLKLGIEGYGAGRRLTAWAIAHGYGPGGCRERP